MALTDKLSAIANAIRNKTGKSEELTLDQMVSEIGDIQTGDGITPTGTTNITLNGEYDVTQFAKADVNITGLNARVFNTTLSSDFTSGMPTILDDNEWIASIRNNSNAFVLMRYLGVTASTAENSFWFLANFTIGYNADSACNGILVRQSTSSISAFYATQGLTGVNYSGHLCVDSAGKLYIYANESFPLKAGDYQIIAGTVEML